MPEFFPEEVEVVDVTAYLREAHRCAADEGNSRGGARARKGVKGAMVNFVIDFSFKDGRLRLKIACSSACTFVLGKELNCEGCTKFERSLKVFGGAGKTLFGLASSISA